jgi:hypothetical protein
LQRPSDTEDLIFHDSTEFVRIGCKSFLNIYERNLVKALGLGGGVATAERGGY